MPIVFDVLLCLLIVAVALSAVFLRDLFAAIVFFIVYGLFIAIAWVRVGAVDVALAEAAIGAGLTGLLLVGAAARLKRSEDTERAAQTRARSHVWSRSAQFALCVGGAAGIVAVVWSLGGATVAPRPPVVENLDISGVSNPVTAVLLNFRAYDTLLEAVVLALALVCVWSLTPDRLWGGVPGLRQHVRPDGVLVFFGRLLPVIGLLIGVYLVWAGTSAPGGAFQAGTVLAAVWLLVAMAGLADVPSVGSLRMRWLVIAGPAAFLLVGLVGALSGTFLGYPPAYAGMLIVAVEFILTATIAVTLALLVLGVPRRPA